MRTIDTFYGITVDISDELVQGYAKDTSGFGSLAQMLEKYAEIDGQNLRRLLQQRGFGFPATIRMLESHGIMQAKKRYTYTDLQEEKLITLAVEDWITAHEGRYECLYVSVCNSPGHQLAPRKSLLVYPQGIWSGADLVALAQGQEANEVHIVQPEL